MKRITRTPEIDARLRAAFGEASLESLVVYEVIAANTRKLRKTGGLYRGARMTVGLLQEMADAINNESIPMQIQHDTSELPIGRVFSARVVEENLHALVAMNGQTQGQLISDIEAGVIDQVSVSILSKRALCSECGFDYMGPEANAEHWWTETCANKHTIGVDGVHVTLAGLQSFIETSWVGRGAVPGARLVDPSKAVFREGQTRLAASEAGAHRLICTAVTDNPKEPVKMELKDVLAQLTAAVTEKATLTAELAIAKARITELEAQVAAPKETKDLEAAITFLKDIATKTAIATGDQNPTVPATLSELTSFISDRQAKLSAIIPVGGRSKPPETDAKDAKTPLSTSLAAFRTTRS